MKKISKSSDGKYVVAEAHEKISHTYNLQLDVPLVLEIEELVNREDGIPKLEDTISLKFVNEKKFVDEIKREIETKSTEILEEWFKRLGTSLLDKEARKSFQRHTKEIKISLQGFPWNSDY